MRMLPRVQVHFPRDAAGQERRRPAIFAVADDRVADRRHVDAQLVRAAGEGLQFDPGGAVAGALDHAVAGARGLPLGLVDVHLFAAGAGLLGDRQFDHAVVDRRVRRRSAPNRPCARCGWRTPWRRTPRRARCARSAARPRYPCRVGGPASAGFRRRIAARRAGRRHARCVLVPPCVARPGGLLRTIACASLWITISRANSVCSSLSGVRSRFTLAVAVAATATRSTSAGGTRICCPACNRSPGAAREPSMRNWPVRAQRETRLKLVSGKCRLNQRSSRMPSSS